MQHIHFIGICGVAMSALAVLFNKKGWKVTGSDVGFYPPVSTYLEQENIAFYAGWHPEKMGKPDIVVVGNVAGSENAELKAAEEQGLRTMSYPELVAEFVVKKNSIVCVGTYGKSSSTTLVAYLLKSAGKNPTYMIGALPIDLPGSAEDPVSSTWSVLEGDEYKTSRTDLRAKFFSYRPTHLLLTGLAWDHADVYPTEEAYLNAFRKLLRMIPAHGLIVACTDNTLVKQIIDEALHDERFQKPRIITYGKNERADVRLVDVTETTEGVTARVLQNGTPFTLHAPLVGGYMAENICGAFTLTTAIGCKPDEVATALGGFHGLKRRLELRGSTARGARVYDDIAHSPVKARSTLETLRRLFPEHTITAVFEPNTGNRTPEAEPQYAHAFTAANRVVLPRLTKLKKNPNAVVWDTTDLLRVIGATHPTVHMIEDDEKLVAFLRQTTDKDIIVFMGSHGFRGMIEQTLAP